MAKVIKINKNKEDEPPKWLVKLYDCLWWLLKALAIVGFITLIIAWKIYIDKWYINWLTS